VKPDELQPILARAIRSVLPEKLPWTPPPEARFVTGNPRWDAQLHHVLVEYGVDVEFSKHHGVIGYRVVDEKKFMMFILRWS
jgi:hypothetical protein